MAVVPLNKLQAHHLDPDSLGIDAVNPGCRTIWSPEGTWPDLPTFLAPVVETYGNVINCFVRKQNTSSTSNSTGESPLSLLKVPFGG
jgi:hypothetical protein